jgi:hypothetical protein
MREPASEPSSYHRSGAVDADVGAVQRDDQGRRVAAHPVAHGRGDLREGQRIVKVQDVERAVTQSCARRSASASTSAVGQSGSSRCPPACDEPSTRWKTTPGREPGRAQGRSPREEVHPVRAQRELLRQVQRDSRAAAESGVADDADG